MTTFKKSMVLALVLSASVVVGCEKAASQPANPGGANQDVGSLTGADGTADAIPTTDSGPDGQYQTLEPPFVCAPADVTHWEEWVIGNHYKLSDPKALPPKLDDKCKPIYDKSCSSVCDCKFMGYECGFVGANRHVPWHWVPYSGGDPASGCWQNLCALTPVPKSGENHLQCIDGQCYADGLYSADKMPPTGK